MTTPLMLVDILLSLSYLQRNEMWDITQLV
jgi:hypothetical protein